MTPQTTQERPPKTGKLLINTTPLLIMASASAGLLLGVWPLAPLLHAPPWLGYLVAYAAIMGTTLATSVVAPVMSPAKIAAVILPVIAVMAGVYFWGEQIPKPLDAVAVTVALLLLGGVIGGAVGGRIQHPGHLLVVAVVSLLADTFSVYHPAGPTAAVIGQPRILAVLALPWPILGTREIFPILGVGDVIFASIYLSASRRFALGIHKTAAAVTLGLIVTMIAVVLTTLPIPALVAMGLAVLLFHPEARRLPEEDRRKGRIILGILALLWLAMWTRNLVVFLNG